MRVSDQLTFSMGVENISDEQAAEIGIKAYPMKPLVMRDLAKTVRKVLDNNTLEDFR